MALLFGTDGIREKYPVLNELNSFLVSYFFVNTIKEDLTDIYIGYDSRFSSLSLALACASSITSFFNKNNINKKVILSNTFTSTPLMAFISKDKKAYSIQITASHNPFYYNGIKIFNKFGKKIEPYLENKIETQLNEAINLNFKETYRFLDFKQDNLFHIDNKINKFYFKDFSKFYISKIISFFRSFYKEHSINFQNLGKILILLDLGNSAISYLALKVYSKFLDLIFSLNPNLSIDLKFINNEPNGYNINYNCGSVNPNALESEILKVDSYYDLVLGFTYDGDADRTLAYIKVNNSNNPNKLLFLDGDLIVLAIVYFLNKIGYKIQKVALTHMSNLAIEKEFNKLGINIIRVNVGDKYITQAIEEGKAQIGAENSGHVVIPLFLKTGDGLFTSLFFTSALFYDINQIINLLNSIKLYPQKLINIKVSDKMEFMEKNKEIFNKIENYIKGKGRVFIRPSGTEDLIRILIETYDQKIINEIENIISKEVIINV